MPWISSTGSGARNSRTVPGGTTTRPSGLSKSEAIFAVDMFGATPTLAGTPASRSIRAFTCRAYPSASRRASAGPAASLAARSPSTATGSHPVTAVASRYASSTLTSRTTSAASWRTAFTSPAMDL